MEPFAEHPDRAERGRRLVAAAVAQTSAPPALRERIAAEGASGGRGGVPALRRRATAWLALAAVCSLGVAFAIVAIAGGGGDGPSVARVAALSRLPAQDPGPPVDGTQDHRLQASVDGVQFPDYFPDFGFRQDGVRRDVLDGQTALTVFYLDVDGHRVGYSIVARPALKLPGGRSQTVGGTRYAVQDGGDRVTVSWHRDGRTCVMDAARSVGAQRVLHLATYGRAGHS